MQKHILQCGYHSMIHDDTPLHVRSAQSDLTFRKLLKSDLLQRAYK
jgi:hypothetical protein